MDRQIKFRAWNGEYMLPVNGLDYDANGKISVSVYSKEADKSWYSEGGAIMQFTGLLDKNGKEIYEGDIVKSINERVWEVKIGMYQYVDQYPCVGVYAEGENCQYPMGDGGWEIIGNIYENPELIGDQQSNAK